MSVSLTFRCPDDLAAVITSQVEATGQDKTSVVVGMLRSSLPSLPITEKGSLPEVSAIYLVWSSNKLLYIGKTSNLKVRFFRHHRLASFLEAGNDVRIGWFQVDLNELPSLEGELIELLEPDLNEQIPGQVTKVISFRLDDDEFRALQLLKSPDDISLSQTAARLLRGLIAGTVEPSTPPTPVDIQELVKQEVEQAIAKGMSEIKQEVDERLGKLSA